MNKLSLIDCSPYIEGLVKVELGIYSDARGINMEGFNPESYPSNWTFKVDSFSMSTKGVLRGLHGDPENNKLVQCLYGKIFFVVIDIRQNSPTFGKIYFSDVSAENGWQFFVPKGCVNAHQCISDRCVFSYKLSNGYVEQDKQILVKWNDPKFSIPWPISNPTLSERDK